MKKYLMEFNIRITCQSTGIKKVRAWRKELQPQIGKIVLTDRPAEIKKVFFILASEKVKELKGTEK